MKFNIRELPFLSSFFKNKKEPEKQAEEVKEERKKLKKETIKGVSFDRHHAKYRARISTSHLDIDLGLYGHQAQAERAVMDMRAVLRRIPKGDFYKYDSKVRSLAKEYRSCARAGGLFVNPWLEIGLVDQWDANTPAR